MKQSKEPGEMPQKKSKAASRRRITIIATFLVLVLISGMVVGAMLVLSPNIQTQTAIPASMTDFFETQGYVVLSDTQVTSQEHSNLYYTVPNGERVPAGSVVANAYASGQQAEARVALEGVNTQLAQLQEAQSTYLESGDVEALLKQRQTQVYSLLDAMDTGNYGSLQTPLSSVAFAANKLQIATGEATDFNTRIESLTALKQQYEAASVAEADIVAPAGGYFVPSGKYDRVLKTYDELAALTPEALQAAMQQTAEYYSTDVVGHIVSDYKWYFFTIIPAAQANKFAVGSKLQLLFPDYTETTLPVTVEQVDVDEILGIAKVQMLCEHINATVLGLRLEKAQVVFSTQKGIRIDKKALRIKDGEYGVFVKVGNLVRYRKISILLEDENYVLISDTVQSGVNEVQLYDEVIVDNGGLELYDKRIL
ncbi:MAG: HlyD family efflux transporter periplasmic adaptor subunit [Oscillospiraceae bacterium]